MARDLRLQVILDTIDKASAPLKGISKQSAKAASAIKDARAAHKLLNKELKTAEGLQKMQDDLAEVSKELTKYQDGLKESQTAHDAQKASHKELTSELKASEKRYKELSKAIIRGEDVSQEYRDELERTRTEMNLLQKQVDKSSGKLKRYTDAINSSKKKITSLTSRQSQLNEHMDDAMSKLTAAGISTDNLADSTSELRRKVDASTTSIEQQKTALAALEKREKSLAKTRARIKSVRDMGGSMVARGAGATATGGAALAGMGMTLMPGIDYDAQKSAVQAITRLQANDPRLNALHEQSAELGASTSYTSTEVAQGQEFLARAGYSPEAIKASMSDVLALAKANRIELAQAADIASNISGAFRIDAEAAGSMQRVSDVLTATTTRANVDMQMLGEAMKYLGQATGLDMSLEQAAAMAGFLGNIGIQGSEAGTTMRAMMTRLAAPTGAAQEALQELDVQVADTNGNLRQIPDILADINRATAGMGNVAKASYLKDIFGEEPGSGMALLIEQQGQAGIDKFVDILKGVKGENAAVAAIMGDNIQGDINGLQSAIQSVSNVITDANNGPLRDLIQTVTANVRAISGWIKENPELTRQVLMVAGGGAALLVVLGALLSTVGLVTMGIATTASGFLKLAGVIATVSKFLLANPIVAIIAAIAASAYLIYDNWDTIGPYFKKLWQWVKEIFTAGMENLLHIFNQYSPIGVLYNLIKTGLEKLGIEMPATFTEFGANLMHGLIKGIKSLLPDVSATIGDVAGNVSGWFKEKLGIQSPSKVFASHGSDVMAGLEQGLDANADQALDPIDKLQANLKAIGAGLAISATAIGPVSAVEPATGPKLSVAAPTAVTVQIGDIHIHPTPGMDERALASLVRTEIERVTREQLMRQRTRMRDSE